MGEWTTACCIPMCSRSTSAGVLARVLAPKTRKFSLPLPIVGFRLMNLEPEVSFLSVTVKVSFLERGPARSFYPRKKGQSVQGSDGEYEPFCARSRRMCSCAMLGLCSVAEHTCYWHQGRHRWREIELGGRWPWPCDFCRSEGNSGGDDAEEQL